jgi:hypothetical protein
MKELGISMGKRVCVLTSAVLLIVLAGCSGGNDTDPPVATPTLTLNHERVPIGSPLKLTYSFQVADNATFDGDYWVFVHVLDPEGERLWTDDHLPVVPTSQWKSGQKIEYTRTVFVQNYPYIGEARVRLGLYRQDTGKRLALNATEISRREYEVARFQLLPQSENIFLIFKEGWHPAEVAADNPAAEWQWTKKTSTLSFKNPRRDSVFYLEYDARTDLFPVAQQVTVRLGEQVLGSFAADSRERQLLTFPLTAVQLGPGDMAEIVIDLDKTFNPGGGDTRELGIRVFHAFVDPR